MLSKHEDQVSKGLQAIVLDYQSRGSKVVSAFGDRAFEPIINWARQELHLDLTTCAADSHVSRAENAIRFVKDRLRSIQCETPSPNSRGESLLKC